MWHPLKIKFLWGGGKSFSWQKNCERRLEMKLGWNSVSNFTSTLYATTGIFRENGQTTSCNRVSYTEGCSRSCLNVHQEENELQVSISPRENLFPETLQLMKWGSINSSIITMRALALYQSLHLTLFTLITGRLQCNSSIGWSILGQLKCDVHLNHGVYLLTKLAKTQEHTMLSCTALPCSHLLRSFLLS